MYDVITFGSATIDIFVHSHYSKTIKECKKKGVRCTFQAYPIGSKLLIDKIHEGVGGGGINTAIALRRLGNNVAFMGNIGHGPNAAFISNYLKNENITNLAFQDKKHETGTSIILDSIEHDRTILAYKGANDHIHWSNLKKIPKTKWFYFSTLLKDSFTTQKKLAKYAAKNKIKIAFNSSEYLAEKGLNYLKPILKHTTIYICNREEATLLTKENDLKKTFKKIAAAGPEIVIITDGKRGATAYNNNIFYQIAPKKIKVVETTGAGDAFAASFLAGLLKFKGIEKALQLARINAESVIQHPGATNKLLTWREACQKVKKPSKIITT